MISLSCSLRSLGLIVLLAAALTPSATTASPVPLSERVGPEIDAGERTRYGLFPDIHEFESGRFESSKDRYRLVYVERGGRSRSRSISREAFQQTAWHLEFTDESESAAGDVTAAPSEPDLLRRLALRYAARKRYDLAREIASDLREGYPAEPAGVWAVAVLPRFDALAGPRRAVIYPGALLDQRGRTDLIVFSGYYGLWLGAAIPIAFEAEDAQAFAAGLLAAPTACVLIAVNATRNAPIPSGQATIISLGGHLGTWQGLGWSGLSDAEGHEVVATGVAAGLAGIALAIPLSNAVEFSEGHAQIMNSAMYWGGWLGAVEAVVTNRDEKNENSPLVDMLIASDVAVLATGIAARNARLSKSRMRLINLCGVLGTAFGGGIVLLTESGSEEAAMGVLGLGSVAGLIVGVNVTKNHDAGKDLGLGGRGPTVDPVLAMRSAGARRASIPTAGIRVSF
ncbi:MAG TPA: hypothetical protein VJW75_03880 [Candidatus Eisenbacteria bacterium]|nr:hypothetical protein [Candidatus Eisenbacteria bacterium]